VLEPDRAVFALRHKKAAPPVLEGPRHSGQSGRETTGGSVHVHVPGRSAGRIRDRSRTGPPARGSGRRRSSNIRGPNSHSPCSRRPRRIRRQGRANVRHRSAHAKTKLGCLCRCCAHSGHASHHCCSQHPIPYAAHNPSVSAGRFKIRSRVGPGFSSALRFGSCCLRGVPVMY
jgi:hypothetical protein